MSCLNKCCGTGTEKEKNEVYLNNDNKIYIQQQANLRKYEYCHSSIRDVINSLKNINKEQKEQSLQSFEKMANFVNNIAKEYDQQIEDIKSMKQNINKITDDVEKNDKIKDIVKLNKIEDQDELANAFNKVAKNLNKVIEKLQQTVKENGKLNEKVTTLATEKTTLNQAKEKAEGKLNNISKSLTNLKNNITDNNALKDIIGNTMDDLGNLNNEQAMRQKLNNAFNNIKTRIDKDQKEAETLAQSNIVNSDVPNNINQVNSEGCFIAKDMFGKQVRVKFLSQNCKKIMTKDQITNNYNPGHYDKAIFYYLQDNVYQKLNNLKNIKNLDTTKIILAYHKNQ